MTVYLVTNLTNGKKYIGITRKRPERRWSAHKGLARAGSNVALHRAIRKYGVDQFAFQVIYNASCVSELIDKEKQFIIHYGSRAPHGYNMTDGGDGSPGLSHTIEIRNQIGARSKGRRLSEQTKLKISEAHKGKTLSAEHRSKMAAAKLGKRLPPRSTQHSARISDGLRAAWKRRKEHELL